MFQRVSLVLLVMLAMAVEYFTAAETLGPSALTPGQMPFLPAPMSGSPVSDTPNIGTPVSQPLPTVAPPKTYNPTGQTSFQQQQQQQQQQPNEVNQYFTPLTKNVTTGVNGARYDAGSVIAPNESQKDVNILQSNETGVENAEQKGESGNVITQTTDSSTGTSPILITLIVLAAVGVVALAGVVYYAKKKQLDEKRIDDDLAMIQSFDTFSSPLCFEHTIAKI